MSNTIDLGVVQFKEDGEKWMASIDNLDIYAMVYPYGDGWDFWTSVNGVVRIATINLSDVTATCIAALAAIITEVLHCLDTPPKDNDDKEWQAGCQAWINTVVDLLRVTPVGKCE